MLKTARYLCLFAVLVLAGRAQMHGQPIQSTCWLTCGTTTLPLHITRYEAPGYTEAACCSGEALQCPPGQRVLTLAWGSPAELCED